MSTDNFCPFRWKSGVASSLNYIKISDEKSPVFHPYPSWEANELPADEHVAATENYGGGRTDAKEAEKGENILEKNNSTIISTFRIRVDECDRLWVMDSGLADILGSPKQWAPNSIAIFDLNTDKLIRRFAIPADQVKDDSFFANIVRFHPPTVQQFSPILNLSRSSTRKLPPAVTPSLTCPTWAPTPSWFTTLKTTNPTESSTISSISIHSKGIWRLLAWISSGPTECSEWRWASQPTTTGKIISFTCFKLFQKNLPFQWSHSLLPRFGIDQGIFGAEHRPEERNFRNF